MPSVRTLNSLTGQARTVLSHELVSTSFCAYMCDDLITLFSFGETFSKIQADVKDYVKDTIERLEGEKCAEKAETTTCIVEKSVNLDSLECYFSKKTRCQRRSVSSLI